MGELNPKSVPQAGNVERVSTKLVFPAFDTLPEFTPSSDVLQQNSIVGFDGRDIRSRPFAMLRSQVQRRLNAQSRLIGVTSAMPSSGKSFVSVNLASALARISEAPVYLIDLDLRRASVAPSLGIELDLGLSDVLADPQADLSGVGFRIAGTKMAVYPTRLIDEGSSELLSGERVGQLIAGLRALDPETIVICDLPPVFAGDDAIITIEQLDGYILVVDSGQTTTRQVTRTIQILEPKPCFGTILNRYRGGLIDSYGYSQYYGAAY